jgi:two-component system response regulator AtoC
VSPALDITGSPARGRILVVDDEENVRRSLVLRLERIGYSARQAADGREALAALDEEPGLAVVLCDVRMPGMGGLEFLDLVRERPGLAVLMMSAYGDLETEDEALRRGAADFISKPFRPDELKARLDRIWALRQLETENRRLRDDIALRDTLGAFVGRSGAAQRVMDDVRKIAVYASTVLLTGESGTGKELLARALHNLSPRASGPFIAVNCAAIPESLLESELFGHERGAFTGAVRQRAGLFEQAHTGTLLLDEIGDMPRELQTRLLRVLEDGRVRRIGGSQDLAADVRLVAATAQRLDLAVSEGRFREDLYYRLNVLHVHIPPLRERRDDIPLLVETLVARAATRLGRPIPEVSDAAMELLCGAPWPGNVRQLEHALERGVILAQGQRIEPGDLPPELRQSAPPSRPADARDDADLSIKRQTERLERELIVRALERTGGNRSAAARLLDISYKALLYKIKDYGVE